MEMKYVVPDMAQSFGTLEFAGESEPVFERDKNNRRVLARRNKKASLELQQQIENAEIAIIENAGHEVNTDNPTLLGQKLNVFFKQYV